MTQQSPSSYTVNETLDAPREPRMVPITLELVIARLRMGPAALVAQVIPEAYAYKGPNTPVTPTIRSTEPEVRNADPAPAMESAPDIAPKTPERLTEAELEDEQQRRRDDWDAATVRNRDTIRDLIRLRMRQAAEILRSVDELPVHDEERVERELLASVLHHKARDLLLGGQGEDMREAEEREWERRWRSTPAGPEREAVYRSYDRGRRQRYWTCVMEGKTTPGWYECY